MVALRLAAACAGLPIDAEQAEAMLTLMRTGWGQENPAFRQIFTSLFIPGATPEQMEWFNNLQRITTSAENAVKMRLVSDYMNVADLLPQVKVPTLVMHCRDDAVQPFEEGRRIAAGIPGATLCSPGRPQPPDPREGPRLATVSTGGAGVSGELSGPAREPWPIHWKPSPEFRQSA